MPNRLVENHPRVSPSKRGALISVVTTDELLEICNGKSDSKALGLDDQQYGFRKA